MNACRRLLVAALSLCLFVLAGPAPASPPAPVTNGFAGAVEGGTSRSTFGDLDSLRRCLATPGNLCVPERPLTIEPGIRRLMVAGNVTLDGRGMLAMRCDSYCLDLRLGGNVIRGIAFSGPGPTQTLWPARFPKANCTDPTVPENLLGCAVPIHLVGAQRVIIEGNTFNVCGDKCIAADGGDAITIRRNRFADSFFGILAVARPGAPTGHMTVTENVFHSVFRRSARASGDYVLHEFANIISGACPDHPGGGFGPSAVGGAQVLVEYNVAEPGSCSALEISEYDNRKTGVKLGAGRMTSRANQGISDRDDGAAVEVPYTYQHAPLSAQQRAAILSARP